MPSIIDLWDEKKYSEDDPVRQLIAATKAVKEWPMDTLNWGNELVDMTTGGLNKIFPRIPKTHLAKTLPHSIYGDKYDSPSLSEYPAQDVQDGRTVGRLLNPALLFGGNQRVPLPKTGEFNAGRRALITQEAVDDTDKLSAAIEALKNKPMTRRDFNKGMVAGGAAVAASPLLSKFATKAEKVPEIVKAAEVIPEASKTYKYNTLQDYITDVSSRIEANAYDLAYEHAMENGYNNMPGMDKFIDDFIDKFNYNNAMKTELEGDALRYTTERQRQKASTMSDEDYLNYLKLGRHDDKVDTLTAFSPRAKEEMKALKKLRGNDWNNETSLLQVDEGFISGPDHIAYTFKNDTGKPYNSQQYLGHNNDGGYRIWLEAPHGGGIGNRLHPTFEDALKDRQSYIKDLITEYERMY